MTAMLDLDRFKLVNDTLGHLAGDQLIREVCATIQSHVPEGAMVARLGGDEFGIFFDAEDAETAVSVCDRIVTACASTFNVLGHAVRCGRPAAWLRASPAASAIRPTCFVRPIWR